MKSGICALLLFLSFFNTPSKNIKIKKELNEKKLMDTLVVVKETPKIIKSIKAIKKRISKDSVFQYVLNKTKDTLLSIRIVSIVQTETGFCSNVLLKKNNVCGFTNSKGYKTYASVEESLDELVDYEKRKGNKSWYWYTHSQYTDFHRRIYYKIYNQNLKQYGKLNRML